MSDSGIGAGRPPQANGNLAELPVPSGMPGDRADFAARASPPPPWPGPAPRGGVQSDRGLPIDGIPRRMRLGVPATAEIALQRARIDSLAAALVGRGAPPSGEAALTRALSVRLSAPKAGFWIEPATPETHWIDISPGATSDGPVTWRWTIVPRRRGRQRLALTVSAHMIGADGAPVQSTPPERAIDVKVGANHLRRLARLAGWAVAAGIGAAIAYQGEELWAPAVVMLRRALGMMGA